MIRLESWIAEGTRGRLCLLGWFCLEPCSRVSAGCRCWGTFPNVLWLVGSPCFLSWVCKGEGTAVCQLKLVSGSGSWLWHGEGLAFILCSAIPQETRPGSQAAAVPALSEVQSLLQLLSVLWQEWQRGGGFLACPFSSTQSALCTSQADIPDVLLVSAHVPSEKCCWGPGCLHFQPS